MGQDVVKAIKVNGKLVQTGRDELSEASLVALAGFGRSARVVVEATPPDGAAVEVPVGGTVAVVSGLSVTVKVRGRV
jgi:hypothetical protein